MGTTHINIRNQTPFQPPRANKELMDVSALTARTYSHRVTAERVKKEVRERFDAWIADKSAEIRPTPITEINWARLIDASVWRRLPFTADPKNPKNEKGFRDALILETVAAICSSFSSTTNVAFICNDYALRTAADERLGKLESFSSYESLKDFESFIELTTKNLTERFVKSILFRARERFHSDNDSESLVYRDNFLGRLREEFKFKIDNPSSTDDVLGLFSFGSKTWVPCRPEDVWITRPQFEKLEGDSTYHWLSKVTFVRLFERETQAIGGLPPIVGRRLMVLVINVRWKSEVRKDGRFFDCGITGHEEAEYTFNEPTEEQLSRYEVPKGVRLRILTFFFQRLRASREAHCFPTQREDNLWKRPTSISAT